MFIEQDDIRHVTVEQDAMSYAASGYRREARVLYARYAHVDVLKDARFDEYCYFTARCLLFYMFAYFARDAHDLCYDYMLMECFSPMPPPRSARTVTMPRMQRA